MKQVPDLDPIVAGAVHRDDRPAETEPPRKRGRRGSAVAGSVAALVMLAAGMTMRGGDDGGESEVRSSTRVTAPARDWDAECDNDGDSRGATAAELPSQLLYFPGYVPVDLALWNVGGSIWPDHLGCHHGGVALVLGEADGDDPDRLVRSVQVSGPSYRPRSENFGGPGETAMKVRGGDGAWFTFGGESDGRLLWADAEGGGWTLIGARDLDEALGIADGLRIDLDVDGPPVVAEDIPDDLEVLWERPEQEGAGYDSDTSWTLTFYGPEGRQDPTLAYTPPPPVAGGGDEPVAPPIQPYSGPALSIGIERMSTPATAFAQYGEATRTEIRGHPALLITDPNGSSWITWDEEYGVTVRVSGSVGLAELRKVAESLRPVTPDDPRLSDTRN